MDLWSRKVVGWSFKDALQTEITLEALDRAVAIENSAKDLIHHSDRGVQYSSLRYQHQLWLKKISTGGLVRGIIQKRLHSSLGYLSPIELVKGKKVA